MSFVRIYQGRVSKIENVSSESKKQGTVTDGEICLDELGRFHALFSDAVNYYSLAFGAVIHASETPKLKNFVGRLKECWKENPRHRGRGEGLEASFRRTFGLKDPCNIEEAFETILAGNDDSVTAEMLCLAGESLLGDLGGEGSIQQGSKTYFPLFCVSATAANFPRGRVNRLKAEGKAILPSILWTAEEATYQTALAKLHFEYFANPNTEGTVFQAEEARARLRESLDKEHKYNAFSEEEATHYREVIDRLPDDLSFPKYTGGSVNKEALERRLNVYLLLRYVDPSFALLQRLRDLFPEPRKYQTEFNRDQNEERLVGLGNDPIKLSRGSRGYVFPAFTSLSSWKDGKAGTSNFRGFDVLAFAEALKGISQFQSMTDKREDELRKEEAKLDWMLGKTDKLPPKEHEDDASLPILQGDPRFEALKELLSGISDEDGQVLSARTLHPRALRGFTNIRERWLKCQKASGENVREEDLLAIVQEEQAKQSRTFGDANLFGALAKPTFQLIWHKRPERGENVSDDILRDTLNYSELMRRCEDLRRPVNFSPAHPTLSCRQFLFSDLTGKSKMVLQKANKNDRTVVISFAQRLNGLWREVRAQLTFTAPRIHRDDLIAGTGADWLPPMMKALGAEMPKPQVSKEPALALMPKVKGEEMHYLLNMPVTFEFAKGQQAGLKRLDWNRHFNGVSGQRIHLHDPETLRKDKKITPWFEQANAREGGFQVLGVDLGLRSGAACSLLEVARSKQETGDGRKGKPCIDLGYTSEEQGPWVAKTKHPLTVKLPGEDQKVCLNGKWRQEFYGSRGRFSTDEEYQQALLLESQYVVDGEPGSWVGSHAKAFSFPEQNDKLLIVLRRLMSQRRQIYRFSWMIEKKPEETLKAIKESVVFKPLVEKSTNSIVVKEELREAYEDSRESIQQFIETLGDRILPVRGQRWHWRAHTIASFASKGWHELVLESDKDFRPKIKGQRGLSIARLEQITAFRKCLLSYNRSCLEVFAAEPKNGESFRGEFTPEPCLSILDRLTELKDQRIKQTAHGIIQHALGLRLKSVPANQKGNAVHGVYEKVPGRRPADLIVMEDLARYRASQGRGKQENGALMQWCHRAVLDKVKQMAEPFGIPVIEVQPAYSSRFHSLTGSIGFRANRVTAREAQSDFANHMISKLSGAKGTDHQEALVTLFQCHREAKAQIRCLPALFIPQDGGTDFIGLSRKNDGRVEGTAPYQADLNAATNLALSAIAAPTAFHIHRRVRIEKKKAYEVVRSNKREKAAFPQKVMVDEARLSSKAKQNVFIDMGGLAGPETFHIDGIPLPVGTSLELFSAAKRSRYEVCRLFNNTLLKAAGLPEIKKESALDDVAIAIIDEDDEIPM